MTATVTTGRAQAKVPVIVVLGPTASGKTGLALRLAEKFGAEIVNADSMQVYRGMDIGTAKPSASERRMVRHHLLDIVDPDCNFSASDFRHAAERAIQDISGRGKRVVIVGGTGLYIRALLEGLVDSPRGDKDLRSQLETFLEKEGKEAMLERLNVVDPVTASRLHPNDHVRIIRALEVYHQTGRPISEFRDDHRFGGEYYRALKIGIRVERDVLYGRIDARVDEMLERGLVHEVEELLRAGYDPQLKSMRSIGYRQVCSFLREEVDRDEAIRLIKRDTRRYAKRQLTWFKADPEIIWVEYPDNFDTICGNVIEFLSKGEEHAESAI